MPLAGRKLSYGWALALCYKVGFRGRNLTIAVAVMCAESGRYVEAWHENYPGSMQMSTDRGLFQINDMFHPDLEDPYSPISNAQYAFRMSSGQYFSPWLAYVNNAHLKFLPLVWAVRNLTLWKGKIHRVRKELG